MAKLIDQAGVAELVEKERVKALTGHNKFIFTSMKEHTVSAVEGITAAEAKFLKGHMKNLTAHLKALVG